MSPEWEDPFSLLTPELFPVHTPTHPRHLPSQLPSPTVPAALPHPSPWSQSPPPDRAGQCLGFLQAEEPRMEMGRAREAKWVGLVGRAGTLSLPGCCEPVVMETQATSLFLAGPVKTPEMAQAHSVTQPFSLPTRFWKEEEEEVTTVGAPRGGGFQIIVALLFP